MAATSDTLALAAEERAKQGIHELEISFGGELDLHKHFNDCVKNLGHQKFIPIRKLMKYHIPGYNSASKILEWVRQMSGYTVKLSVNYVSPNRPPGYPLSDLAGQRVLFTGSGYVAKIPHRGNDKMPCPFTNCGELPGNHEVCGYITVVTAAHVVFDDEEAKNTTVEFFDDDPDDRSGVMTARGVKVAASSVEGDFCELLCVTHDASLVQRLNEPRICMPYFTVTFSENCTSHSRGWAPRTGHGCNRSTRPLWRNHLSSEFIYPTKKLCMLPEDPEEHGNITVNPANRVVDNTEAKNAALEFFYDDPDDEIREMSKVFRVDHDYCKQLCVTHDTSDFHSMYCLQEIGELSGRQICDLFQTLLPGLENIKCTSGIVFQFFVKIRLSNLSEALQTLALLQLFTVEDVQNLLNMSTSGYDSSHDLLKSTNFKIADIFHLISYELNIAKHLDGDRQSTSFVHLRKKLTDLCATLRKPDAENPRNHWHDLLSIISELVQFYSTVGKSAERFSLSLKAFSPEFDILNSVQCNYVSILTDTANIRVTILRRRERDALSGYNKYSLDFKPLWENGLFVFDRENSQFLSDFKPNDMFLVHIAHPHGQSKQVTIGRQTDCFTGDGFYHQLYTAPTCPGCSGGPVWVIPASGDLSQVYGVPHSGHIGNELNRGCSWTVYPHHLKL